MPKKQTKKPKYPKELYAIRNAGSGYLNICEDAPELMCKYANTQTVAIYKFDRMAKITRTVKVE